MTRALHAAELPLVQKQNRFGGGTPIPASAAPAKNTPHPRMATYDARVLVQGDSPACIMLDGTAYFLRITRAGKLILTK